ncbi:SRPBCC family protein [Alicyclobacillus dauci]|uniref:Carbon monoxide dehydrogenase subunit G n=1 Tax=Alicyclobacillus dauci TaxID=1475485 RepID=A0ABY6YXS2_9BACL|nr:carbon monoxide dehydrogenase subunit G [Alicyclobacillus dauci]WAH35214.1 carbon monoxide dehydrogenase subunit G [Alicyclobacillus dauci]
MDIQGEVVVDASQEEVWRALNDPEVLQKATPGCKSLTEVEPDGYKAEITLGIAAVRGEYESELKILEKSPPNQYRLIINAESSMGFVQGDALVTLRYQDDKTYIQYNGTAQAGGLIASVGQRILSGIAKLIVKDFFKKIVKEINAAKIDS